MKCGFPPGQSDRKSLNIFESFMLKLSLETINCQKEIGRRNREKGLLVHSSLVLFFSSCFVVKSTVLMYQSPSTGLFPTKTCGGDQKSKVHESLYCAAGAWALALAYR